MKNYYRVMLGKGSLYAEQCFAGNFIGADFGIAEDLTDKLPEAWRTFNEAFIPIFLVSFGYKELNRAEPDCGTTFTWATKAFGPKTGWLGGWGIIAADVLVMASLAQVALQRVDQRRQVRLVVVLDQRGQRVARHHEQRALPVDRTRGTPLLAQLLALG